MRRGFLSPGLGHALDELRRGEAGGGAPENAVMSVSFSSGSGGGLRLGEGWRAWVDEEAREGRRVRRREKGREGARRGEKACYGVENACEGMRWGGEGMRWRWRRHVMAVEKA